LGLALDVAARGLASRRHHPHTTRRPTGGKEIVPHPEHEAAATEKAQPAAAKKDSKKELAAGGYDDAAARLDPGKPPPTALLPTPADCVPLRGAGPKGLPALMQQYLPKLALGETAEVELEGVKLVLRASAATKVGLASRFDLVAVARAICGEWRTERKQP